MRQSRLLPVRAFFLAALLACLASACAAPKAYERGRLAKPKMLVEPDPYAAILEQHVFEYREGSAGGYGGGGGGCGCN